MELHYLYYHTIVSFMVIFVLSLLGVLIWKRQYVASVFLIGFLTLLYIVNPVRFTTNTGDYNHQQSEDLRQYRFNTDLPERIHQGRPDDYRNFLDDKIKELYNRSSENE